MAERDIEVKRSFRKCFRQTSVMRVEQMVVQLKAHPKDRIRSLVVFRSHIKECLAKFSTEIKCRSNVNRDVLVTRLVQILTQSPTRPPCLLLRVSLFGEDLFSMDITETSKRVT